MPWIHVRYSNFVHVFTKLHWSTRLGELLLASGVKSGKYSFSEMQMYHFYFSFEYI